MTAYMIFTRLRTKDPEEMALYSQSNRDARAPDMTVLAVYGEQEVLEGDSHEGVVLLSFPDMAAAKRWYDSDAYRAAREHRFKGADYQVTLIEGLSPPS
jgi:uncharacterized protein (DUF1330 family)